MNEEWFQSSRDRGQNELDDEFLESEFESDAKTWPGFGEAFRHFMTGYVTIIRSSMVANCVGVYLYKGNKSLEFFIGEDDKGTVRTPMMLPEGSLCEKAAGSESPFIDGQLPRGTMMDGIAGCEIRSFIAAPMTRGGDVKGVLAVGSDAVESFGEEDRFFMERCADTLIHVMDAFHHGLCSELDIEVNRVYLDLELQYKNVQDEDSALLFFVQNLKRLFKFHRLTLSVRQGEEGVIRHVYGQVDHYDRNVRFPLNEGLNGWVMKRNTALIIADINEGDYIRPRYSRTESTDHGLHSFLGIPLGNESQSWGCVSLESKNVNQYNEKGKDILTRLAVQLENKLNSIQLQQQFQALNENKKSMEE
jgi:putative methionine-R-sulfoxide reductase with GAF domain